MGRGSNTQRLNTSVVGNGKQKAGFAIFKEMIQLLTVTAFWHAVTGPADTVFSKRATLPCVFREVKCSVFKEGQEARQVASNHSA